MMFGFILLDNTFTEFPVETIIHWAQGAFVGWLVIVAHFRKHWHLVGYAIIATACFLTYETVEQAGEGDRGWVDILNFTAMLHISALLTWGFYILKNRYWRKDSWITVKSSKV